MPDSKPEFPNHLPINPRSPHFDEECFECDIGIRLKGKERADIEEYNISEGWVKISSPTTKDRFGRPLLIPALR